MGILDLIFPRSCLVCKKEGAYICEVCLDKVAVLKQACPYCEKASIDGFTHTRCQKKYGLDGLTSIWKYQGLIKASILALKFKYSTEVGKELSGDFVRLLRSSNLPFPKNSVLIPIPVYWHRQNIRGFNQSEEIGKLLTKEMGWGFVPDFLIKKHPTISQVELTVEDRKKNIKGVFALNPGVRIPDYVILFDDVFTTGSTLKEAAKVLKHAGVTKVWGMTVAR